MKDGNVIMLNKQDMLNVSFLIKVVFLIFLVNISGSLKWKKGKYRVVQRGGGRDVYLCRYFYLVVSFKGVSWSIVLK